MKPGTYKRRKRYPGIEFTYNGKTSPFFVIEFNGRGTRITIDFEAVGKKARNDIREMLGAKEK